MQLTRSEIIDACVTLGTQLVEEEQEREAVIHRASVHNPWFTKDNIKASFQAFHKNFLNKEALHQWIGAYPDLNATPKTIGLIMAGNIPCVGFHDLLAVIVSGHSAQIKLSDKDPYLLPWIIKVWSEIESGLSERIDIVSNLNGFDAVIATGSNQSARYFEQYFGSYPHIIRKNRNAVAVLNGNESPEQLKGLAHDIFAYFGLGCRNVSKIYVPEGYQFDSLIEQIDGYRSLANHSKYRNNIDYNSAINILNRTEHISLPHLMIVENDDLISRIGCLHYSQYNDSKTLQKELKRKADQIQCVVSETIELPSSTRQVGFGQAQAPGLDDYADGVDTMDFLTRQLTINS